MAATDVFSCAFARHQCSHEQLFQANYQRTNRTKGSKILRCFPHCCPDHIDRSFCGAPLYVEVNRQNEARADRRDVANRADRVDDAEDRATPVLLVFGRFRLHRARSFAVDDLVAPGDIAASIQSDSLPDGEWIESRELATASHEDSWLFEVNSAARWFYSWESGVAKSHRLKEHVLDVIVMAPTVERDAATGREQDWLRVVAVESSPPFKMISFRRATPDAVRLLAKNPNAAIGSPSMSSSQASSPLRVEHARPASRVTTVPATDDAFVSSPSDDRTSVARPDIRRETASISSRATLNQPYQPWPVVPTSVRGRSRGQWRDLVAVWTHVQQIGLEDVLPVAEAMEKVFLRQCERSQGVFVAVPHYRRVAIGHTLAALLDKLGVAPPTSRKPPSPLRKIVLQVAAWGFLDVGLHREWEERIGDAVGVLLDLSRLRETYEWLLQWLWTRLDEFLRRADWSLPALVAAIADHGSTRQPPQLEPGEDGVFEAFVAHVRECYVDRQRLGQLRRRLAKRQRVDAQPVAAIALARRQCPLNGDWVAMLDDIDVRHHPRASPSPRSGPPLVHLLSFWRQLGALSVHFDAQTQQLRLTSALNRIVMEDHSSRATALDATSASSAAAATEHGMVLVLDRRSRWFRRFPSGESTTAAFTGRERFGDYVGAVASPSASEIHVNCYSWPTVTTAVLDEANPELVAYCYQLQLSTPTPDVLRVRIMINGGCIGADAFGRESRMWPLPRKLACVPQWKPLTQIHCDYRRLPRVAADRAHAPALRSSSSVPFA